MGSPGRILVGGSALARAVHGADGGGDGYVEADLPAPDGSRRRTRVWDTGDLGVFHPGGELEILGRCDSGIKIRGSWVEPGEIEEVLEGHPVVRRACVTAETDPRGQTELVAYVVPEWEDLQAETLAGRLRAHLASRVSQQSLPGRFVPVTELPLLPSGKVDRRQLRLADLASSTSQGPRSEPDDLQEQVLAAFREALDDPEIGPRDDFEASGGHSLRAIRLCGILPRRHRAARSGRRPLPAPHSAESGPLPPRTERTAAAAKVEPARAGDRHSCRRAPGTADSSPNRPGDRSDRVPGGGPCRRAAADDPC